MRMTLRTALVAVVLAVVGVAGTAGAAKIITGHDIKNGSIGLADLSKAAKRALKGHSGPQGPQGPQGPAGATGARGPAGPASITTTVVSNQFSAPANGSATGEVRCPSGMVATGGSVSQGLLEYSVSRPSADRRGWVGSADNFDPDFSHSMTVYAVCTPGS